MSSIVELLHLMLQEGASDLFLAEDAPPRMRVLGQIRQPDTLAPVAKDAFTAFFAQCLPAGFQARLEAERDIDVGVSLGETDRFRLSLYYQKGRIGMAARRVPSGALSFGELAIPDVIRQLAEAPRGLIIITGSTGSGKSTTMAAILHHINTTFTKHLVTIEDPIEFMHRDVKCLVSQREVGSDTRTFAAALRHVVRQNPDVIFIGEMRDLETMETAIRAAMTGHLVVTTLHTADVAQTLERIINYFPAHLRDQVAQDLASALAGIVSQRLLPQADGRGSIPVFEILTATPLARRSIAKRQLEEIDEILKSSAADGMTTFTNSLVERCKNGRITLETGARYATNRGEFLLAMEGMKTGIDTLRDLGTETQELSMRFLLRNTVRFNASDLLITAGSAPTIRLGGVLQEFDMPILCPADTQKLLFSVLSPAQRAQFETEREIDFALTVADRFSDAPDDIARSRFRVNGFYQKGAVACVLRLIPQKIPDPAELMIPPVIMDLANRRQGLILVTGPTGHGKSTTLACLIDRINKTRSCHIVTVEDPIEFVHTSDKAVIEQREVFADTKSFASALKYVLRQAPDVILVGEMRDTETIAAALTAAETGHLVLATLHTNDCPQTIDRIIDSFPGSSQSQVRAQLAASIEVVISQRLLPRRGSDTKRVAAFEIMFGTDAVRAQIRDDRTHQLAATLEVSAKDGMVTMDKALTTLYTANLITRETFRNLARNPAAID